MEFKYEGKSLKGGVYKITNKQNGRTYYGSSKEFKERWKSHKYSLVKQKHSNKFLQADFNKCGPDVFVFEVVEVIEGTRKDRLLKEEVFLKMYFDHGKQCYNLCDRAISREGFKAKNPEETGRKISLAMKGRVRTEEHKKNLSKALTGKKLSIETRKKISEVQKGRKQSPESVTKRAAALKGRHHTEETKRRIGERNKGKIHTKEQNRRHGETLKGRKLSKEHIEKLMGHIPWNKGKKTGPTGRKLSEENKRKLREANVGKIISRETRQKISNSLLGNIPWNKGKKTQQVAWNKGKCKPGSKPCICVETGEIFSCVGCAGRAKNINSGNLYNVLMKKHETAGGFHWAYV